MPDEAAARSTHLRWASLTKPEGSLGRLEELGEYLAAIRGTARPRFRRKSIAIFVADHGVTEEGVSAYPRSVTTAMVENFIHGGAAINVLARLASADVEVIDIGVDSDPRPETAGFRMRKIARGTRNFARGPALDRSQAEQAVDVGMEVARELVQAGTDLLAIGDMGIGNTSCASAMVAALTGVPVATVVGRGTGVDDERLALKRDVIEKALSQHPPDPRDPWSVLEEVGGFEIAGMAGACLGAATARVPVIIDGFIATTAALWATALAPPVREYLVPSHLSVEPGHRLTLERLRLRPYLDLDMRLGEGTGAALQMLLCEAAVRLLDEMATFDEAAVARRLPSS
jgi:nicotinate-nucleotide--dimethylbenzimidazole phosphoribosyltransferase